MASLFEQYEKFASGSSSAAAAAAAMANEDSGKNEGIINLRSNANEDIFAKHKIDFKPPHPITHMVVSNSQLFIAMSNNTLLKIDVARAASEKPIEIDLNLFITDKSKPTQISDIFIDPTGRHCIISMCLKSPNKDGGGGLPDLGSRIPHENFYYNKKVHHLTKLKGFIISAVGWNHNITVNPTPDASTGNILIGTSDGRIFETQLQPDDRFLGSKELFLKQVCELPDNGQLTGAVTGSGTASPVSFAIIDQQREPICAINCFKLKASANSSSYCILVATSNFLYYFIGDVESGANWSNMLSDQAHLYHIIQHSHSKMHKEMPGYLPASRLDLFYPPPAGNVIVPKAFGWLTKPGIFYNEIHSDLSASNASRLFDEATMLMLSDLISPNSTTEAPISLVLTKFHILLLYPSMFKAICVLNQQIIYEDKFSGMDGRVLGICRDSIRGTVWVFTEYRVYRYKITQEDRNIWEIYLKKKDFNQARLYAGDDVLKQDRTICEEALHYFSLGDYKTSANLFATARSKTFEEIALKFIELRDKDQEALKEYLFCKLQTLSPVKDRTQIIILLLWLFEIALYQLGSLKNRMEDCDLSTQDVLNLKVDYNRIEANLKDLMSNPNFKACLKKNRSVIYTLILNHNNPTIMIYFAEHIDDFERLLDYYIQQSEYDQALTILRKEECLALYYRYAPILIQERPGQLIAQLMPLAQQADFATLIPALVHFDNAAAVGAASSGTAEAITTKREEQCREILRFLEYCVFTIQTDNSLVHNYLIALYAQYQPDKLLTYLQLKGGDPSFDSSFQEVPYDVKYAARLCTQLGLGQATVFLLATMGSIEEAVEQALADNDVDLAKQTAEKVSTVQNPDLVKRLWLKIAKHVINTSATIDDGTGSSFNMKMATNILTECPLLKIEDLLPYFPEFSTIDHFKEAICSSLEEYNRNIESLREDMKVATESAQDIREEIRKLRNRYTVISASDKCSICDYFVLTKPFYSFHCGHMFHQDCLLDEIRPHLSPADKKRLDDLERSLMRSITNGNHSNQGIVPSSSGGNLAQASAMANNSTIVAAASSSATTSSSTAEQQSIAEANRREEIYAQIDDLVASECFYCGHYMISTIDKPFIDSEETNALKGWL